MTSTAEQKGAAKRRLVEAYLDFLDDRVPKLMAQGYKGRTARRQADREWAEQSKQRERNAGQDHEHEDAADRDDHGQ